MSLKELNFDKTYPKWAIAHSALNIVGVYVSVQYDLFLFWIAMVIVSFFFFIVKYCSFTYANLVTVFRLLLIVTLAISWQYFRDVSLFVAFLVAIAMDGLDGYLARKFDESSLSGETLDMESDALLLLVMTWIHFESGKINMLLFLPATLRYSYELSFFWLKKVSVDTLPKRVRSTVAVVYFMAVLLIFIDSSEYSIYFLNLASVLIVLSFVLSVFSRLKYFFHQNL